VIKPKHTEYLILLAVAISILSLILSIVGFIRQDNAGRYQTFGWNDRDSASRVFDTKTSRLFMRDFSDDGKLMSIDLGTVDQPVFETSYAK
jgi:hypothetical protein